jgi:uncharacterized protein
VPEYLAPGVYVEETSFRPKTIEGVSTSTAGFVGPARFGPIDGEPELITSFNEYERLYGGLEPLIFEGDDGSETRPNFLAHAVRAFFEEGGRRCYVARVYEAPAAGNGRAATVAGSVPSALTLEARFPGAAGEMRVTIEPMLSQSVLRSNPITGATEFQGVRPRDVVVHATAGSLPDSLVFQSYYQATLEDDDLVLRDDGGQAFDLASADADVDRILALTVAVTIERPVSRPQRPAERYDSPDIFEGFTLDPRDQRSLAAYFTETPGSKRLQLSVPFAISFDTSTPGSETGIDYATALFGNVNLANPAASRQVFLLENGSDGAIPTSGAYRGESGTNGSVPASKSGLGALEAIEDISIVAAPGSTYGYTQAGANQSDIRATQQYLISHCERMKYRIAVLDAPDDAVLSEVRAYRGQFDSKHAAMYYPWVTVISPLDGRELNVSPSGHVAGIYARNDTERGVQKAPANEVVRLAVGFEKMISKAQQEVLNPEGINCFRFFEGRGNRLWGARTITSDGEWKYVNLRRYFAYLERSIDKGTQVFVFESNGDRLWENVRRTVEDFLLNEWKSGRLMGLKPEEAYFVRCDRTTMTQNDIDNGRLICLIGVAPLRPAEFVIFRIGQKLLETRG